MYSVPYQPNPTPGGLLLLLQPLALFAPVSVMFVIGFWYVSGIVSPANPGQVPDTFTNVACSVAGKVTATPLQVVQGCPAGGEDRCRRRRLRLTGNCTRILSL